MMTDDDLKWLAGFVDGEGYIGLIPHCRKESINNYQLQFQIQTTSQEVMQLIAGWLDTKLTTEYSNHPIWKDSYRLRLYDKKAAIIIEALLPYLKLKKQQAQIALQYRETIGKAYNGRDVAPEEISKIRRELCEQMAILNHRGKKRSK